MCHATVFCLMDRLALWLSGCGIGIGMVRQVEDDEEDTSSAGVRPLMKVLLMLFLLLSTPAAIRISLLVLLPRVLLLPHTVVYYEIILLNS